MPGVCLLCINTNKTGFTCTELLWGESSPGRGGATCTALASPGSQWTLLLLVQYITSRQEASAVGIMLSAPEYCSIHRYQTIQHSLTSHSHLNSIFTLPLWSWDLRKSSQTNWECQVVPSDPSRPPCRCRLSEDIQIGGESSLLIRTCHSLSILINWTVSFKWSIMLLHLGGNVRTDRITNLISRSGQW